jgi:hypothetical protein
VGIDRMHYGLVVREMSDNEENNITILTERSGITLLPKK